MAAVQFYGINEVVEAANNRACPRWAIFQGSQYLFKNDDPDMNVSSDFLQQILTTLQRSTAIYSIRFYEEDVKIKANTPYDGSFNFKLIDNEERENRLLGIGSVHNNNLALEARIKKLEAELEADDEEPQTLGAAFLELLKNPADLAMVVNVARGAIGLPIQDFGTIAGVNVQRAANGTEMSQDEKLARLGGAIDTLEKGDPRLIEHLEKLAKLSVEQPDRFKATISMLDLQK